LKPQRENFTMHCLGLDQEFQLAKIPVQTLGGTPDGDNIAEQWSEEDLQQSLKEGQDNQ
jgi:hypothetical protein